MGSQVMCTDPSALQHSTYQMCFVCACCYCCCVVQGLWFTGIMFLTNVFFIPFMALRARPEAMEPAAAAAAAAGSSAAISSGSSAGSNAGVKLRQRKVATPGSQQLPGWSPVLGAVGAFLGEWGGPSCNIGWDIVGQSHGLCWPNRGAWAVELSYPGCCCCLAG